MKRKIGLVVTVAVAVLVAAFVASSASAATPKKIPFKGAYSGSAVVTVTDNVADIKTNGNGTASVLGAGKIVGVGIGDASQQPCVPFTGTGTLTGPGGKIVFKVIQGSNGCGDEAGEVFSVTARATVTTATGKLAKAKGTFKITGTYDRNAATFAVKLSGTLLQ